MQYSAAKALPSMASAFAALFLHHVADGMTYHLRF
jgi:hypothetical protein